MRVRWLIGRIVLITRTHALTYVYALNALMCIFIKLYWTSKYHTSDTQWELSTSGTQNSYIWHPELNQKKLHTPTLGIMREKFGYHIQQIQHHFAAEEKLVLLQCIYKTDVRLVQNQSENGKYNLISGRFNKISKRFLWIYKTKFGVIQKPICVIMTKHVLQTTRA